MSKEKIRITLQSFNHLILNECCKKISDVLINDKSVLKVAGPISFPTRKRSYCVLRSPHVNKDSREQFEIRRYKKIIDIEDNSVLIKKDVIPVSRSKRPELMKRLNLL